MELTKQQQRLVHESFARAMELYNPWNTRFYDHFFERAPHLRHLFRDDIAGQEMRFMTTLKVIVDNLGQGEGLKPRYVELGDEHALIGIKPADYELMEGALMDTLGDVLGAEFTPEVEAAWRLLYQGVAIKLQQRAPKG